ncbi:hypothetical protein V7147_07685 [Bacillus sp. JJ1521]|uniref:hypothetical protein n=1 Tax=Bacillus sp. JJ1521 TaxID=3122957 RepID=UPI002FFF9A95
MNISMYIGVILAIGLIRWEQKRLQLKTFLMEVVFMCIFITIFQLVVIIIKNKLNIRSVDFLPESLEVWVGGIIIFAFACYLSFRGWRKKGASNSDE